ncbi:MAG: hypothetical protein ACRC1P_12045 [Cellulosilyticaceae bacterium]
MVKQDKTYIAKRKKHFLVQTVIWAVAIIVVFSIGILLTKERGNIFTIFAAIMTLGFAQNLTRFISFNRYKDPKIGHAEILEEMKGNLALYHGAIVPDTTMTVYFEHVVVTAKSMYFISSNKVLIQKTKSWLSNRLMNKGIGESSIHFVIASDEKAIKNASLKIEKDACLASDELEKNINIIEAMLM